MYIQDLKPMTLDPIRGQYTAGISLVINPYCFPPAL